VTKRSRLLFAAAAALLLGAFAFPLWRIDLIAPQYPEGLGMLIKVNTVTGIKPNDLANINGLNHYIGMKAIDPNAIPELRVMPWILGGLVALGLLGAALGSRKVLYAWLGAFVTLGAVGLVDFWRWTYDYGHNLDFEHAIIKVPGMTYQPPLIGTKQLLNFTATSWPALGTAFLGVAFGLAVAALVLSRRRRGGRAASVALAAAAAACSPSGPREIALTTDACDYCRMTISDVRFAGQVITAKGKIHAFDSIDCLASFVLANGQLADADIWVADYNNPGRWVAGEKAVYVLSEKTRVPMGISVVSFAADADPAAIERDFGAAPIRWADVLKLVQRERAPDATNAPELNAGEFHATAPIAVR
jgi:copper chaperone NosL